MCVAEGHHFCNGRRLRSSSFNRATAGSTLSGANQLTSVDITGLPIFAGRILAEDQIEQDDICGAVVEISYVASLNDLLSMLGEIRLFYFENEEAESGGVKSVAGGELQAAPQVALGLTSRQILDKRLL